MLESFPVSVLVGTVLGFLSGLGIGGGSLLILWLTMILGMEHYAARGINLLFFIPSAVVAIFFRRKQGAVRFRDIMPAIIGGCASAAFFYLLGKQLDLTLMKKLFGGLLIITGLREFFYRKKTKQGH